MLRKKKITRFEIKELYIIFIHYFYVENKPNMMNTISAYYQEIEYSVGEKWVNTENGVEFFITEISENLISMDDGQKKLSSFDHMNKVLFFRLVREGVYKRLL